jgi:pSer/pThr/pTyr-binding forkhead associated (FHA) protein
MFAFLQVVSGSDADKGRTAGVTAGNSTVLVIGRDPKARLHLYDSAVALVHCRLTVSNGTAVLVDAGSANGTLVNGIRIQQQELHSGDVIRVGNTEIQFQWSQQDEIPTTDWMPSRES